jgi:hypothetical protein
MPDDEVTRALKLTITCSTCGLDSLYPVAMVIAQPTLGCPNCLRSVDLSAREWATFRDGLLTASMDLQPLYRKVP